MINVVLTVSWKVCISLSFFFISCNPRFSVAKIEVSALYQRQEQEQPLNRFPKSLPYFWPESEIFPALFGTYLWPEKVASSLKHTQFKPTVQKTYPI